MTIVCIYTAVHNWHAYMHACQVFSVLAAVCAAVVMSRLDYSAIAGRLVSIHATGTLDTNTGTIVSCALLLAACVGVTICEIVLLVLSLSHHPCSSNVLLIIVS